MFCYKCGAEIDDEAVICPKCGCAQPHQTQKLTQGNQKDGLVSAIIGLCFSVFISFFGIVFSAIGLGYGIKAKKNASIVIASIGLGLSVLAVFMRMLLSYYGLYLGVLDYLFY